LCLYLFSHILIVTTKQSTLLSSFNTTSKNIYHDNDDEDNNDDVQINKQITINDVVAIRNNECKLTKENF
jgi:hypothetical protein